MTRKTPTALDHYTRAAVVLAVRNGAMSRTNACEKYAFSAAELRLWEVAYEHEGVDGLRGRALSARRRANLKRSTDCPSQCSTPARGQSSTTIQLRDDACAHSLQKDG
jgi:hypothetical protein